MSASLTKLWNDYGIGTIVVLLIVAYAINIFSQYLTSKGRYGSETMSSTPNSAYAGGNNINNVSQVVPANPAGENEVFSSVHGIQTTSPGIPSSCSKPMIQNPNDLLPKGSNNVWSDLNPSGKGELSSVNLLKAGYHIGIDTIGQTLRNANLQIRSEYPNPQIYVGPWNQSTIEPDFMRPPLEIGVGTQ